MNSTFQYSGYADNLSQALLEADWTPVQKLAELLEEARKSRKQVFLCGNGGSAANAIHWANDFTAAIFKGTRDALRTHALPSNVATLSCLANDLSYETVFSQQLRTLADPDDLLIVMSGSGNSPNILAALREARELGVKSVALLGFDGGAALELADLPIHFKLNDMQIVEDLQLVVGHMLMRAISESATA